MHIKIRNQLRIFFIVILSAGIITILVKYNSYEQRILLYKMLPILIVFYLLVVEYPLAVKRNTSRSDQWWKKIFVYVISLFAFYLMLIAGLDLYNVTKDIFKGYNERAVTIIKRELQYRASDKVWVQDSNEVRTFSLAPGYIDVSLDSSYDVHIFEHSRILIPVKKASLR